MELLSHAAGVKFRHVPFGGAGPALTAILGGHVADARRLADGVRKVGRVETK
jgi:tripartite-type tricarboxylate transporter receptor subunit TctC